MMAKAYLSKKFQILNKSTEAANCRDNLSRRDDRIRGKRREF